MLLFFQAAGGPPLARAQPRPAPRPLEDYSVRFGQGESVVAFTAVDDRLYVRPVEWSGRQPLERVEGDRFRMEQRPERTFAFGRDAGRVARVDVAGMDVNGRFERLGPAKRPLEDFVEGRGRAAYDGFGGRGVAFPQAVALVREVAAKRASCAAALVEFLEAAVSGGHQHAATLASLGQARIATGDRKGAREALEAAARLDPALTGAQDALRMLAGRQDAGWELPFPLDAAYRPPTAVELARVERIWDGRDLSPAAVNVEDRYPLEYLGVSYEADVVSHLVHGSRHYGVVLTPSAARPRTRPVVLEIKGVSWNYFTLAVPDGSTALRLLGGEAAGFVFVLPGLRGETLRANGREYRSEGDPSDSWDGATDDAIAFLNVALQRAPAADPGRIAAFGRSRGGSVALLAGERDPRIGRVLAWSAPAGWIEDMRQEGWTQREMVGEGLRRRSSANEIGGQPVRTFLRPAVGRRESLEQVRNRLIASSPVYFVRRLPRTEAHWGLDDPIVPSGNGERIRDAAGADAAARERVRVVFHAEGGHDLDPALARPASKAFLLGLARDAPRAGGRAWTR